MASENSLDGVSVTSKRVFSALQRTYCYKIKQINDKKKIGSGIEQVSLYFFTEIEQLPTVEVYLTSESNSPGVIFAEWGDGKPLEFIFEKVNFCIKTI